MGTPDLGEGGPAEGDAGVDDFALDGNAIGGMLMEIFGTDMTMAVGTCGSCGSRSFAVIPKPLTMPVLIGSTAVCVVAKNRSTCSAIRSCMAGAAPR